MRGKRFSEEQIIAPCLPLHRSPLLSGAAGCTDRLDVPMDGLVRVPGDDAIPLRSRGGGEGAHGSGNA